MMESPMTRNCHVGFGERYEETHQSRDGKVRFVPTLFSPLLANIALNGIEKIGEYRMAGKTVSKCVRYDVNYWSKSIGHNLSLESSCQEGLGASRKKEVRRVFLSFRKWSNN
jgi:hypothetical protein